MVMMPGPEDLRPRLPGASRGQPRYPTSNPVAEALQGFGNTIANIGFNAAERERTDGEKTQSLGVQSRFLQFEDQWSKASVDRAQGVQPGAAGFTTGLQKDYTTAAKEFFKSIPDDLKPAYDARLFDLESRLTSGAQKFEREELDRYSKGQVADGQNVLLNRQAADPSKWQDVEREGEELIRNRPGASPIEADADLREWRKRRAMQLFETRRVQDEAEKYKLGVGAPAGMRNNNPGNIKYVGQGRDRGVVGPSENTDQGDPQAVYVTPEAGMADAYRLAKSKYDGGKKTANQLIAGDGGWTPGNTQAAANIAKSIGVSPDADLDLDNPQSAAKFMRALIKQEHGPASNAYSDTMITNAIAGRTPPGGAQMGAPERARFLWTDANDRVNMVGGDARLRNVNPNLQTRVAQAFTSLGINDIHIRSGFRSEAENRKAGGAQSSQHLHGNALDISVKDMPHEKRVEIIRALSAAGVTGIGVYDTTIHADLGGRRAWGPDYHRGSVPGWAEGAIGEHLSGQSSGGVDTSILSDPSPEYAALDFEDRLGLFEKSLREEKNQKNEFTAQTRADVETAVTNGPVAVQNTGAYDQPLPTPEQFAVAYGPREGAERYDAFLAAMDVGQQSYDFRTASAEDIMAAVEAATPVSSGNDAALQAKKYETLANAAEATLKARAADPSGYTQQTFPSVRQAWEAAGEEGGYRNALAVTAAAQTQLGITDMRLLPKEVADGAVTRFKDENLPQVDRLAQASQLILGTDDPAQREAVFEQLVDAGLPAFSAGAFNALGRGDESAWRNLIKAAMVDPSKLPGKAPETPAAIDQGIQDNILASGEVGEIYYGLDDGTVDNHVAAARDAELMQRSVNLRLREGMDMQAATAAVALDMFGKVQPVVSDNAHILIPLEADPQAVTDQLDALMPEVGKAVEEYAALGREDPIMGGAGNRILRGAKANEVARIMDQGFFKNSGDGFVFIDPYDGLAIEDANGNPIIFKVDLTKPGTSGAPGIGTGAPVRRSSGSSGFGSGAPAVTPAPLEASRQTDIASPEPVGLVEPGNIDLDARKVLNNADGSISTEQSASFNIDGVEVLLPTVIGGKKVSDDEAIEHYRKTGEHLGKFKTPEAADAYADALHDRQEQRYTEIQRRIDEHNRVLDAQKPTKPQPVDAYAAEKKRKATAAARGKEHQRVRAALRKQGLPE